MNEYLIYTLIGVGGALLRHYFPQLGNIIPGGTSPVTPPSPPGPPAADKPLLDCLAWLQAAKVGATKVDEQDVRTLQAMKPFVDELAGAAPKA